MSIFITLVYPDNEKRAKRALELSNDVVYYYQALLRLKGEIDSIAIELTKTYQTFTLKVLKSKSITIDGTTIQVDDNTFDLVLSKDWKLKIPYLLGKIIAKKAFTTGLSILAGSFTATKSAEAAAGFARIVRLPSWFLVNEFSRSFAASLLADLIISAIKGSDEKKALQKIIRDLIDPRLTLFLAVRQSEAMLDFLKGMLVGLEIFSRTPTVTSLGEEEFIAFLNTYFKSSEDDYLARIDTITTSLIASDLERLDKQRQSFMDDDKA